MGDLKIRQSGSEPPLYALEDDDSLITSLTHLLYEINRARHLDTGQDGTSSGSNKSVERYSVGHHIYSRSGQSLRHVSWLGSLKDVEQ